MTSTAPGAVARSAAHGGGGWPPGFVDGTTNRAAALALAHLAGLTPRKLLAAAWRLGAAADVLRAVELGDLGTEWDRRRLQEAASFEDDVRGCGARFVVPGEDEYPARLADLDDPPIGLFVRGVPLATERPAVAIVGARRCTAYGKEVATALGRGLAGAGLVVVSGAAHGIDGAAHEGALAGKGRTVAVLGCGLDVVYPPGHRALIERIAATGTLVSEYPPRTKALPRHFPARNRIVAGMAAATVVVEGAPGSGSMITVDHAHDCGREVLAVPGPVTSPLSGVPHQLIREGAPLVRDAEDVLSELGLGEGGAAAAPPPDLPPALRDVLTALAGTPQAPEVVASHAGLGLGEAMTCLLELEMRGLARRVGGRFERTLLAGR